MPSTPSSRNSAEIGPQDPGSASILNVLDPNRVLHGFTDRKDDSRSSRDSRRSSMTLEPMEEPPQPTTAGAAAVPGDVAAAEAEAAARSHASSNIALAAAALRQTDSSVAPSVAERRIAKRASPPPNTRVDSAQSTEEVSPPNARSRGATRSPLRLQTSQSAPEPRSSAHGEDTLSTSPTLSRHVISVPEGDRDTLPAVQPVSPMQDRENATSPRKLPSFRQLTGQLNLNELAEAAAIQGPAPQVPHSRHNSVSYSSTTAPSPRIPYHYPPSAQTSPVAQYPYSARSPTSTVSDMTHAAYGSPNQYPSPTAYYADRRRSSAATEFGAPYPIPSLPSASSSGESHGQAGSSTEGYSTAHTTPIDAAQAAEGQTPRPIPILPPPRGMPQSAIVINGGFRCDYPGCNAAPFQTQYLLR